MGGSGSLARLGDRVRIFIKVAGGGIIALVTLALVDPLLGGGVARMLASQNLDAPGVIGSMIVAVSACVALAWAPASWWLYGSGLVQERLTMADARPSHFGVHPSVETEDEDERWPHHLVPR